MSNSTASKHGRPKKPNCKRRSEQIKARFNVFQAAKIRHAAELAGITPSEYVYRSAVRQEITIPKRRSVDPQLITEINELACQVRDLGHLYNQGLKYFHNDRPAPDYWPNLLPAISENQARLATLIDKMVGCDGS